MELSLILRHKKTQAFSMPRALGFLQLKSLPTFHCIDLKDCRPLSLSLFYWACHLINKPEKRGSQTTQSKSKNSKFYLTIPQKSPKGTQKGSLYPKKEVRL